MPKLRIKTIFTALTFGLFALSSTAFAQGSPKLSLQIKDVKINQTAAEKSGKADISYTVGDTIQYIITASNVGDGVMKNPKIVDPIPAGVEYIANSAQGERAEIQFSIDGGSNYQDWPVEYEFTNKDGKTIKKQATPDMITHVRWVINATIPPKGNRELSFQVRVK